MCRDLRDSRGCLAARIHAARSSRCSARSALIALAVIVWRNAAQEGVFKFSLRHSAGLLLGCVAFRARRICVHGTRQDRERLH